MKLRYIPHNAELGISENLRSIPVGGAMKFPPEKYNSLRSICSTERIINGASYSCKAQTKDLNDRYILVVRKA